MHNFVYVCCYGGYVTEVRLIVTEERSGIIQKDDQKQSELIFVCNNNHMEVVNTVSVKYVTE